MKDENIITLAVVLTAGVMETVALITGHDGEFFGPVMALLGGVAGAGGTAAIMKAKTKKVSS